MFIQSILLFIKQIIPVVVERVNSFEKRRNSIDLNLSLTWEKFIFIRKKNIILKRVSSSNVIFFLFHLHLIRYLVLSDWFVIISILCCLSEMICVFTMNIWSFWRDKRWIFNRDSRSILHVNRPSDDILYFSSMTFLERFF